MAGRNSPSEPPVLTLHICTGACGHWDVASLQALFPLPGWWTHHCPTKQWCLCWLNFRFTDSSDHTIPLPSDLCCSYRISAPFVPVHVIMTHRSTKSIHVLKSSDTMCLQSETVGNRSSLSRVTLPRTFQVSVLAGLNVIIVITSANEVEWPPAFVSAHLSEQIDSWMNKFQWNSSENVDISPSRSWSPLGEVPEGLLS